MNRVWIVERAMSKGAKGWVWEPVGAWLRGSRRDALDTIAGLVVHAGYSRRRLRVKQWVRQGDP